ncbi:MAG: DHHA1 domain-containing protein [Candidatus Woesearchaeota archaeon]|nr:DHHA1 domain-containing protein [Candidatus Woesearchaeota archaeon]
MIPQDVLDKAKQILQKASRPLFYFDDDCDGVTSFTQLYQFCGDGSGVPVKQSPVLKADLFRKIDEYSPDVVVILDKPGVEEEFLQKLQTPTIWIDHHEPQEIKNKHVLYINPRTYDDADNRPTAYWCHMITKQNLWVATLGSIADWHIPDFIDEFKKEYGDLLPETYEKVEDLYLDTPIGQLIKILQFNLKGSLSEMRKSILTFTRVEHPDEILKQASPRGKFLWKKYRKLADGYEQHMKIANEIAKEKGPILLYEYGETGTTYTAELSNELLIRYPEKIILVSRKHDGKRKNSIRSKETELPSKITKAMEGLDGYGGGHTNACGCVVTEEHWQKFYERFEQLIETA